MSRARGGGVVLPVDSLPAACRLLSGPDVDVPFTRRLLLRSNLRDATSTPVVGDDDFRESAFYRPLVLLWLLAVRKRMWDRLGVLD